METTERKERYEKLEKREQKRRKRKENDEKFERREKIRIRKYVIESKINRLKADIYALEKEYRELED